MSAHAGPSAQPPIGTSGIFPANVSAELPSNISPNPSEVISKVPEVYDKSFRIYLKKANFPVKIGLIGGLRGVPEIFFQLESSYLCYLGAHVKIRDTIISFPGIYLKIAHFPFKIGLIRGVRGVPE